MFGACNIGQTRLIRLWECCETRGGAFGYLQDASMDVELSRMHKGIQSQPN